MHSDPAIVEADIETIRRMEKENKLFEFESSNTLFRAPSASAASKVHVSSAARPELY
jgi:hypothetical protein